jgi:general secretion pathway protein G
MRKKGFTLIELLVVMVIVAMLVSIAAPRYFGHIDRAKEASLKTSLNVMRDAIDKFHGDQGRYPDNLDELVTKHYMRKVPPDPITESALTWKIEAPPGRDGLTTGAYDVHSGAQGHGADGSPYAEW